VNKMRTLYIIIIILLIIAGSSFYLFSKYSPAPIGDEEDNSNIINNECLEIGCPSGSIYAGSINSDKYYECKCRWAKSVNEENLVCFSTDAEALADSRTKSEC
tara:strand:+ start:1120 stop:1428 length:309 start_codon:yes stop_codon:yes gene_type:complete